MTNSYSSHVVLAGAEHSGSACLRALRLACEEKRPGQQHTVSTIMRCDVCAGAHQSALIQAGCQAHDVQAYCTGTGTNSLLSFYDRESNGGAYPPGPNGCCDAIFSVRITVCNTASCGTHSHNGTGIVRAKTDDNAATGLSDCEATVRSVCDAILFNFSKTSARYVSAAACTGCLQQHQSLLAPVCGGPTLPGTVFFCRCTIAMEAACGAARTQGVVGGLLWSV